MRQLQIKSRQDLYWGRATVSLLVALSCILGIWISWPAKTVAQLRGIAALVEQVYLQVPFLPRENQYVDAKTGETKADNTLLLRMVRYHLYVKTRTPASRLDWKLTLADYLGVNERIQENVYPSAQTLTQNPLEGDLAAVGKLTRTQRDQLIQALVDAFSAIAENRAPAIR